MIKRPLSFHYNSKGNACIGELECDFLAATYETPLYVLDKQTIQHNCESFLKTLAEHYPNSKVLYAGKANLTIGLAQLMFSLGMNIDVSSGGELYTAKKAGVPASHIYFHGNNKTLPELDLAIDYGVTIIVDNFQELENIKQIVERKKKIQALSVRLKPEIYAHTHDYIRTGQLDSKFGIERKDLDPFIISMKECDLLKLVGIHSHIGSQIFDEKPFLALIDILLPVLKNIKEIHGISIKELNCGGGMGIYYTSADTPIELNEFVKRFTTQLKSRCDEENLEYPVLLFEPGRSIIGPAGITLYTVGAIKKIENVKNYIFIDGGMADNPRPIMYQAKYDVELTKKSINLPDSFSIAGKYCESGDVLAEALLLPEPKVGEHLVFFATGAYNYSMSSNYNRNCRPAMILVEGKRVQIMVKRENYEDLCRFDQELDQNK
jgi:diaminopimelate decarboxylase